MFRIFRLVHAVRAYDFLRMRLMGVWLSADRAMTDTAHLGFPSQQRLSVIGKNTAQQPSSFGIVLILKEELPRRVQVSHGLGHANVDEQHDLLVVVDDRAARVKQGIAVSQAIHRHFDGGERKENGLLRRRV